MKSLPIFHRKRKIWKNIKQLALSTWLGVKGAAAAGRQEQQHRVLLESSLLNHFSLQRLDRGHVSWPHTHTRTVDGQQQLWDDWAKYIISIACTVCKSIKRKRERETLPPAPLNPGIIGLLRCTKAWNNEGDDDVDINGISGHYMEGGVVVVWWQSKQRETNKCCDKHLYNGTDRTIMIAKDCATANSTWNTDGFICVWDDSNLQFRTYALIAACRLVQQAIKLRVKDDKRRCGREGANITHTHTTHIV